MNIFLTGWNRICRDPRSQTMRTGRTSVSLYWFAATDKAEQVACMGASPVYGDITDIGSFQDALSDCRAVIHLIAIIREQPRKNMTFERINNQGTRQLVQAARKQGIERFVHLSALNADPNASTPYFESKGKAEAAVRESGINPCILKPSFIVGPGMPVYSMLARFIKKSPFHIFPVFGNGRYRHQPVSVHDLAKAVALAVNTENQCSGTYDLGGPEALSFNEQLRQIAEVIDSPVHLWHQPVWMSRVAVSLLSLLPQSPIDQNQLSMLIRDNTCDISRFVHDFGIDPMPFKQAVRYLDNSV
ncbi:MAG: NAD-dependent epimerase/dehydratase family protein [candidate division KSB1 bacterium]|nr:NAD-dependent epimerase/dehydratase family protein [candidate division KSB1 bacterium]